ncbi:MAG: HD domain-containing protein [Bacteroidota bacterium]
MNLQTAIDYASRCHAATNHTYDEHPYAFHLSLVAEAAKKFIGDYDEQTQQTILAAAWCHDLIEDARETYNDVRKVVGEEVAELVYALTNEKGRNRAERANDKYYQGIRETQYATLVKVCDRIANLQHSINTQSRLAAIYAKEQPNFRSKLYVEGEYENAWRHLQALVDSVSG